MYRMKAFSYEASHEHYCMMCRQELENFRLGYVWKYQETANSNDEDTNSTSNTPFIRRSGDIKLVLSEGSIDSGSENDL